MNHIEAIRMKATEQYLLGEMAAPLRDEFEDHFMSCQECARDVRAGAAFVENTREILRREVLARPATAPLNSARRESWLQALLRPAVVAAALAILLGVIGYQELVTVPRLESTLSKANAPSEVASFSLLGGNSRGEASVPVVVQRDQPYTLYVDIPPAPEFPRYTLDVERTDGALQFSLPVTSEGAKKTVQVLVPAGRLLPSDYAMVIRGVGSSGNSSAKEIGRARFSVKYAD
jgi:hypothetical protein